MGPLKKKHNLIYSTAFSGRFLVIQTILLLQWQTTTAFSLLRDNKPWSHAVWQVSYSRRRRTLLAVRGDQRARWDLGGRAAWRSFPPRILGYSTVVSLTPSLGVGGGAWGGMGGYIRRVHLMKWHGVWTCVSVLYLLSSIVVYSISSQHLCFCVYHNEFEHSAIENQSRI